MQNFQIEFDNLLHLTMLLGPQEGWVSPEMADSIHEWIESDSEFFPDHSSDDTA